MIKWRDAHYRAAFDSAWSVVRVHYGYDINAMAAWLKGNIRGEWSWRTSHDSHAEYAFASNSEATLFKLKWV